jgi:cellobiose phosphorylase
MRVTLTNAADQPVTITPTAAIPLYARSADDLRDHRHVTSLLHRIHCKTNGVLVRPTLSFDERGHHPNELTYAVVGADGDGAAPIGFFPVIEEFIGEGGTLDWPETIVQSVSPAFNAGGTHAGYEALGGLRFSDVTLYPTESVSFYLILAILETEDDLQSLLEKFATETAFANSLEETKNHWKSRLDTFRIKTRDPRFDLWMRWVALQPTLRRLYGNSFLPAHDYGRGGRGWRDLWQDILALLLMEKGDVSEFLYANFAGVRIDGSNATIIGGAPGEFKADRNNIPRVWMDHGAWPLLTTSLYIHQTGDLAFLLREQTYFKDHLIFRSKEIDSVWEPDQGTSQQTTGGETYRGTILEHLIIQHLTPFYNVGAHNNILLEGADWNDGMDMAPERGESVAFSALYAGNLNQLSEWVLALANLGVEQVELAAEILLLLDTLNMPLDYDSVDAKHDLLASYFNHCRHALTGKKVFVSINDLANDLNAKSEWLTNHIQTHEWIQNKDGFGWFNGYYDNDSQRVEGEHPRGVRMTLTSHTFALMGGIATPEQAQEMVKAADQYLLDPSVGGHRLNTDFGEVLLNLGRAFGFAYGHKENGAMFSHMAVMYANALYQRGLVHAGYKVLADIYHHCQDFSNSKMYPGIPEYINPTGRGMYTWLTGSASWYVLTMVTEVFGVSGQLGDLLLDPKLVLAQFDEAGNANITTLFAGKLIEITYQNPEKLDYDQYLVASISIEGKQADVSIQRSKAIITREIIKDYPQDTIRISVLLGSKE